MNRLERETLLQRYLAGRMSRVEEEEFFIKVALDRELRGELQAHRAIDSAIRKELSAEPGRHSAVRQRTMAMLTSMPAPAPNATSPDVSGVSYWWGLAGLAVAIVTTLLVVLPLGDGPKHRMAVAAPATMLPAVVAAAAPAFAVVTPPEAGSHRESSAAPILARSVRRTDSAVRRTSSRYDRSNIRQERKAPSVTNSNSLTMTPRDRADDSVPIQVHVRIGGEQENKNGEK